MDIRLLFVVLIGVTSSVLVNRDVAVFNDGFRPEDHWEQQALP